MAEISKRIQDTNDELNYLRAEIGKVIVGQRHLIDRLMIALIAEGHVLLEGVPGIAKTLTVNTLAKTLQLDFKRIQFTPDLLPSDLVGTTVFNPREGTFFVQKGPVFTNIVLADEINRAPPKVQSALLEVMQEKQVTIGGQTLNSGSPFMVMATQNPIEHEGTYPLPEAELDRFMMKIKIDYPSRLEEKEIVLRSEQSKKHEVTLGCILPQRLQEWKELAKEIYLDDKVLNYIIDIVFATRDPKMMGVNIKHLVEYGASCRASMQLAQCAKVHALMHGRAYVTPYDVKEIAFEVLRHRLVLTYEAEAKEISADMVIAEIFNTLPVP